MKRYLVDLFCIREQEYVLHFILLFIYLIQGMTIKAKINNYKLFEVLIAFDLEIDYNFLFY